MSSSSRPREVTAMAISPTTAGPEITPPSSWTEASPITPTPLRSSKSHGRLGDTAQRLLSILKQVRDRGSFIEDIPTSFNLAAGEFHEIRQQLHGIPESVRYDYYARHNRFVIKMPSFIHEAVIVLLIDEIKGQLHAIADGSDTCAAFARDIVLGRTTLNKVREQGTFERSRFSPDDQFRHRQEKQSSILLEVAFSQTWKDLRDKVHGLLRAGAQAVIGIDIDYGPNASRKVTLTVWRLEIDWATEVGRCKAIPKREAFRDEQGNPVATSGLRLRLSEFASNPATKELLGNEDREINISGERLYQLIEEAEQQDPDRLTTPSPAEGSTQRDLSSLTIIDSDVSSSDSTWSSSDEADRASDRDWDPDED